MTWLHPCSINVLLQEQMDLILLSSLLLTQICLTQLNHADGPRTEHVHVWTETRSLGELGDGKKTASALQSFKYLPSLVLSQAYSSFRRLIYPPNVVSQKSFH